MGFPGWDKLQEAEGKIVARVRAAIFAGALLGVSEAHNFAEMLTWPASEVWFKRVFGVCMVLALLLRAGEKNDKPDVKP